MHRLTSFRQLTTLRGLSLHRTLLVGWQCYIHTYLLGVDLQ
jgi:hypothetical protein